MAGPATRLFGGDVSLLYLLNYASPVTTAGTGILDFLTCWTDCRISWKTQFEDHRATYEVGKYQIPVGIDYDVSIGARVDRTLPSLHQIYYTLGVGPYRIRWSSFEDGGVATYHAYCLIESGEHSFGDGPQEQSVSLSIQGFPTRTT